VKIDRSNMTREEAYNWLVKIGVIRPLTREIVGDEKDQTLTMLKLVEPTVTSNNQHSWSEDYIIGNLHYAVTYFEDEVYMEVTEIKDDIQQD
jgi:hypothetical protein